MISDKELEAVVRTALQDLYPTPSTAGESRTTTPKRSRRRPRLGRALATALAAVVLVAAAVVLPAYLLRGQAPHASAPAGTARTPTHGPTASSPPGAAPAWTAECIPPGDVRAVDYLGLSLADAQSRAHSHDVTLIVVGQDGSCLPVASKLSRNPLWVATADNRVVEARYRGWSGPPR